MPEGGEKDFYRNKSIFVTGFLEKAIVEKILRSCLQVATVYVLIRKKSENISLQTRLDETLNNPIFSKLKKGASTELLAKIYPVQGDIGLPHLGLCQKDSEMLISNVSVVIHSAASIKFDEALSDSIELNVNGTSRVVEICKKMKKLEALVHISTAYSNCNFPIIDEKIYSPPDSAVELIEFICSKNCNNRIPKSVDNIKQTSHPNTYSYTKAIAECVLSVEATGLPVCIVRPSIVSPSLKEPLVGWTDNINGPTGIFTGFGLGALRAFKADATKVANVIPIDFVVNLVVCAAWETSLNSFLRFHEPQIKIYNCVSSDNNAMTNGVWFAGLKEQFVNVYPLSKAIYYPSVCLTTNSVYYRFKEIMGQYIPALVLNKIGVSKSTGAMKMRNKLVVATKALKYFTLNEWKFNTDNVTNLYAKLSLEEKHCFNFEVKGIDWEDYIQAYAYGIRKYIMNRA